MTLMRIPPHTTAQLEHRRRRAHLANYDDLPKSVIYIKSTGKWIWEATVTPDLLVTVRKVDSARIHSLDADIVDGDAIYNKYSPSNSPADIAKTIDNLIRTKTRQVEQ